MATKINKSPQNIKKSRSANEIMDSMHSAFKTLKTSVFDNKERDLSKHISSAYKKEGYLDKYGGSVMVSALILGSFAVLFGYQYIQTTFKELRKIWPQIKCNPVFMPFAGLINPPPPGSKLDYTISNFSNCLGIIGNDIAEVELAGSKAASGMINDGIIYPHLHLYFLMLLCWLM